MCVCVFRGRKNPSSVLPVVFLMVMFLINETSVSSLQLNLTLEVVMATLLERIRSCDVAVEQFAPLSVGAS